MVVARSSVSCRGFQGGAREVDARSACCGGCYDGVEWLIVIWVVGVGSTSLEVSTCPRATRFFLASNFLEARANSARCVRITGERRAERVSNRLELYALCGGK